MVVGYVIMRVPMLFQWLRAGRQDPERRGRLPDHGRHPRGRPGRLGPAAAGRNLDDRLTFVVRRRCWSLVELAGPVLAETLHDGTPWHGHHIAERYGLMVIICLGEGLLGTNAALGALIEEGWTVDVAVLGLAGHRPRLRRLVDLLRDPLRPPAGRPTASGPSRGATATSRVFGAVVAIGAGLHAAAYYLEDESHLDATGTLLTVAIPLAVYAACLYALYSVLTRSLDPFHVVLIVLTVVLLVLPVVLAEAGVDMVWCLAVLALVPWVTVVGYETVGHQHNAEVLAGLEDERSES